MSLLFPPVCPLCGKALRGQEDGVCDHCLEDQPLTWMETESFPNHLEAHFIGNFPIVSGYSLWKFSRESRYRPLIHKVKYKDQPRLGRSLGRIAGRRMQKNGLFTDIDYLIPIPLHWLRYWFRGYNQSEQLARGIRDILSIPIDSRHLYRKTYNSKQALLGKEERQRNVDGIFDVRHPEELAGKHILLIDDVCTTGSTLKSAAAALRDAVQDIQISIFTQYTTRSK